MKRFAFLAALVLAGAELAAIGCNAVLGNEDGMLLPPDGAVISCPQGQKSCGTCVDTTDPKVGCGGNCTVCPAPVNAQSACALENDIQTCSLGDCNAQFGNCDNDPSNGCETHTTTKENCGSCGTTCAPLPYCEPNREAGAGYMCSSTCDTPNITCGTECIDPTSDNGNCGGCGVNCTVQNGSGTCANGHCQITCNSNYLTCGNQCVSPSNSVCGSSCQPCTNGTTCDTTTGSPTYGTCVTSINPPPVDAGCTSGCGPSCEICGVGASCSSGSCTCGPDTPVQCLTQTTPQTEWCCAPGDTCGSGVGLCNAGGPKCVTPQCSLGSTCGCVRMMGVCDPQDKNACGSSCMACASGSCCCPDGGGGGGDGGQTFMCRQNTGTGPDGGSSATCDPGCN